MVTSIRAALAVKHQRIIEGNKGSVQATKARKGKDKVAAPRKIGIAGKGITIVKKLIEAQDGVRTLLIALIDESQETKELALNEVVEARTSAREEITGADIRAHRARRSSDASFSRVVIIIKAIVAGYNIDKLRSATNMGDMQALANQTGNNTGKAKTQLLPSGFKQFDAKLERVCVKGDDPDALARLERHLIHCLTLLGKFEHVSALPIKALQSLIAKPSRAKVQAARRTRPVRAMQRAA